MTKSSVACGPVFLFITPSNTLSSHFADEVAEGADPSAALPEPLVGKLELCEVFRVGHGRCAGQEAAS